MNKTIKITSAFILSGLLANVAVAGESGVFGGVELGAGIITDTTRINTEVIGGATIKAQQGSANVGLDWGVRLGYQLYFTPTHGARVYASYGMAHLYPQSLKISGAGAGADETTNAYITGQRIDLNIDYLLDFIKAENASAGVYGGLYVGYSEVAISNPGASTQFHGGVGLGINFGVQTTIAKHHRIEFGAKVPFLGPNYKMGTTNVAGVDVDATRYFKYSSVGMSYSFVF